MQTQFTTFPVGLRRSCAAAHSTLGWNRAEANTNSYNFTVLFNWINTFDRFYYNVIYGYGRLCSSHYFCYDGSSIRCLATWFSCELQLLNICRKLRASIWKTSVNRSTPRPKAHAILYTTHQCLLLVLCSSKLYKTFAKFMWLLWHIYRINMNILCIYRHKLHNRGRVRERKIFERLWI